MLLLIVINSWLSQLADAKCGISLGNIYTGSFGHADDLRSITTNLVSLQHQAEIVQQFTEDNFLKLNLDKLELLPMSSSQVPHECSIRIGTYTVPSSTSAKCLGFIWSSNLFPKASIEQNI